MTVESGSSAPSPPPAETPEPATLPPPPPPAGEALPPGTVTGVPVFAGREVPHYVPTAHQVYRQAHAALEKTPEWGQEAPDGALTRFMATPLHDCVEPKHLLLHSGPDSSPQQTALKNAALGCGLLFLGLLMMFNSQFTTRIAVLLAGVYLLAGGTVSLVLALLSLREEGALGHLGAALLHILLGAWMLKYRHTGAVMLLVLVAIWMVFKGFARRVSLAFSVLAILLVLLAVRWRGLPGLLLGYDIAILGYIVAHAGYLAYRGGGGRETAPLMSHPPPPSYLA